MCAVRSGGASVVAVTSPAPVRMIVAPHRRPVAGQVHSAPGSTGRTAPPAVEPAHLLGEPPLGVANGFRGVGGLDVLGQAALAPD